MIVRSEVDRTNRVEGISEGILHQEVTTDCVDQQGTLIEYQESSGYNSERPTEESHHCCLGDVREREHDNQDGDGRCQDWDQL